MTIKRIIDGKEVTIELTPGEIQLAYLERTHEMDVYLFEDYLEELEAEDVILTDEEREDALEIYLDDIEYCEGGEKGKRCKAEWAVEDVLKSREEEY